MDINMDTKENGTQEIKSTVIVVVEGEEEFKVVNIPKPSPEEGE